MFMHFSCMRLFLSFLFFVICCDVLSLSLSLSWINCVWHPKHVSLLWLRTFLVPGLLLLLILFPLLTFCSMMRMPKRTSWRTFRNVAFIRSIMLFCQTSPKILSPPSLRLEARNLYLRVSWGVPSCLYRSFTPIYTVLIPLYLGLPRHFEVNVS